ncbi:Pyridine nucleotide-disulphide oxidoreductase [Streptomyces mirabilis]|uniref:Pyridine nucleotide-disulphide oxidoreductase n=1 Tax=Streptomyces mirabilis TaxID=68239 RepID=A0A1I2YBD9_9ACTN|nr:aldehyde dehydrogenase family protein [Streptomyces mirabilis]SFH22925.1 Pyridine nucleotide-disulphide oxidoreductase [Streptomyces mirabilis]
MLVGVGALPETGLAEQAGLAVADGILVDGTLRTSDPRVFAVGDCEYGLAASVWTRDVARAHRLAHAIRSGTVFINMPNPVDAAAPWGGFRSSGWGREMGRGAIDLYTQVKSVWTSLG